MERSKDRATCSDCRPGGRQGPTEVVRGKLRRASRAIRRGRKQEGRRSIRAEETAPVAKVSEVTPLWEPRRLDAFVRR